ncbi:MAG: DUF421 domain-containing protein [Myxococcales bacterium]
MALRAAAVYAFVQLLLRLVGRKELGRYATSDIAVLLLVTVAARGSIVGSDTSLTSAFVGLATIVGLDWLISYLTFRVPRVADIIEGPVRQLVRGGAVLESELRRTRLSREQLAAFLREKGHRTLDEVRDAYLERSGRVSFILFEPSGRAGEGAGQGEVVGGKGSGQRAGR